ncbi:uncharacterized protein F5147DRAFT_143119 [Suillus discolor]|uniref:Uncharacterized protein n=1 Tax=Suillus discolor TaxID=1912936 RepID=A0A9P7F9W6_9AGAM|nr:uncharacterized protein F5147DRAFT_143119 [Suillus discolor]KAG2109974.1 hypothetical protein F5147DRAFT_143119 [Suillus discolor]
MSSRSCLNRASINTSSFFFLVGMCLAGTAGSNREALRSSSVSRVMLRHLESLARVNHNLRSLLRLKLRDFSTPSGELPGLNVEDCNSMPTGRMLNISVSLLECDPSSHTEARVLWPEHVEISVSPALFHS